MSELVALLILIFSATGVGFIIFRKMPLLLNSPEIAPSQFEWKNSFVKIKNFLPAKDFSSNIFLQKILSKIRILTLKTDNKTSNWLQKLREKSQKNKTVEKEDDYWEKIKNSTKE